ADEGRPAGHLPHVAGELAGVVDRDGLRPLAGLVHDLDLARFDDEESGVAVAGREEPFLGVELAELRQGAAAQRGELGFGEPREGDSVKVVLGHPATSSGGATRLLDYRRYGSASGGTSTSARSM